MKDILEIENMDSVESYIWDCKSAESDIALQYKWDIKDDSLEINSTQSSAPMKMGTDQHYRPDADRTEDFQYGLERTNQFPA